MCLRWFSANCLRNYFHVKYGVFVFVFVFVFSTICSTRLGCKVLCNVPAASLYDMALHWKAAYYWYTSCELFSMTLKFLHTNNHCLMCFVRKFIRILPHDIIKEPNAQDDICCKCVRFQGVRLSLPSVLWQTMTIWLLDLLQTNLILICFRCIMDFYSSVCLEIWNDRCVVFNNLLFFAIKVLLL